jgi:hypothetical protein
MSDNEKDLSDNEKEEMTREAAELKMREWAVFLDLDTKRKLFSDLVEELVYFVQKERLDFDYESETFKYILRKPISGGKKIVEIHETTLDEKKSLGSYEESERTERAKALLSKHTNFTSKEIGMLGTTEQGRITAIVMGFLAQSTLAIM